MTEEEIATALAEEKEILDAVASVDQFLATLRDTSEGSLSEDLQVLSLRLQDATEDLNDGIRGIQVRLVECSRPPRPVRVGANILSWDGVILRWNGHPLLGSSRKARMEAAPRLFELFGVPDPSKEKGHD